MEHVVYQLQIFTEEWCDLPNEQEEIQRYIRSRLWSEGLLEIIKSLESRVVRESKTKK